MSLALKNYEKIIKGVEMQEKILRNIKRKNVFIGRNATELLIKNGVGIIQAKNIMQELLNESIILKVIVNKNKPEFCDLSLDTEYNDNEYYTFAEDSTSHFTLFLCLLFVLIAFALVTFQMWPRKAKYLVSYVSYLLAGFIFFICILSVIRLILFSITYFTSYPGIWLFPNLFADVGFFESFVPLWSYGGVEENEEKKNK